MPPDHRVTDIGSGHPGCPVPRPLAAGSPDAFINGLAAGRVTDPYKPHCGHPGNVLKGSTTIFVNGLQKARLTDPITCGGKAVTGSPNTFGGG